ncbi:hypothetical protein HZU40_23790 [Mycolicibacterium fluoranthenivorans]|uniref:Uncharacterized protein n=1 Tax=Mycolicibacterium fluoranthenivorans TaxID=258505 RepID=A0A7G8PA51_9MYCO|nr:hypothetical protein [Mycolicibacterium fluoranthenivorans]QNJ91217.1 hypothetical protein HZU40_23790 [Mycolicibacterium fluoranthenivorans]
MNGFMRGPQLAELLGRSARAAFSELENLDPDTLLMENIDVLVHGLLARHMPEPVSVDWTAASGTPVQEVMIERSSTRYGERRDYRFPGSRLTVSWPLTGTAEILRLQASEFTLSPDRGTIEGDSVQLVIEGTELSAESIERQMSEVREHIAKRIEWANRDVAGHREHVERELRQAVEARRSRIIENRRISAALNIPITPSGAQRPPVPARRKHVSLQQRRASAEFTPEPVLDKAIYQDILDVVVNWARSLERTCTPPIRALGEEAMRDLLLSTLNGYWTGAAGGELFNGVGRTDILIREGGRNAFIAECKVWGGASRATAALDQLMGYLVWRDTKAALIVFVKRSKPREVIDRLHAAVREHPRHVLTVDDSDLSRRADYVFSAEDGDRRIELAVIPVVFPDSAPNPTEGPAAHGR